MRSILAVACSLALALGHAQQLNRRDCSHDNCLRALIRQSADAATFCASYTTAIETATTGLPTYAAQCSNLPARVQTTTPTATPCTVTTYASISAAVATCTQIFLKDISVPSGSTLDLSKLKTGSVVTFAGLTTFAYFNSSSYNPMVWGGSSVTITAAPGAIIDGNGQAYWDGIGSNGGVPKPDHFIVISKMTGGSVVENLHIRNWPTHLFSISGCSDLTLRNMLLDNRAGDAPNAFSNGLPAAHNSDGFDMSSTTNALIYNNTVYNQDDCVAITSGNNITVDSMYCSGGHGLSIGSVGGKSNNNVTNITFKNSVVLNSQNGPRIKTNSGTTGFISNITYSDIQVSNISIYGIDVQEDYLNGGPTGIPTNGVIIENVLFKNITGTAIDGARDYYVLCGDGSCSNIVFEDVDITGGSVPSSCNFPASGCPN
ncbi:glycosyl hydrolases family 28-domain-containing protein [Xylogone sp. PMI_703]|nr:glycosyl hydrolases family 28-domain-containing protein [Xylogone sp. PMI_703]